MENEFNSARSASIPELALQKTEDNKREIAYIYSKLKNINNQIDSLTNQSGGADLTQINSDISSLQQDLLALQTSVNSLTSGNTQQTTDISNLQTALATAQNNLTALRNRVSANETNITNLQTQTATNTQDISNLQTQVLTNATNITANTTNITNLTSRVSTNETNITNLSSQVATNTQNITALQQGQGGGGGNSIESSEINSIMQIITTDKFTTSLTNEFPIETQKVFIKSPFTQSAKLKIDFYAYSDEYIPYINSDIKFNILVNDIAMYYNSFIQVSSSQADYSFTCAITLKQGINSISLNFLSKTTNTSVNIKAIKYTVNGVNLQPLWQNMNNINIINADDGFYIGMPYRREQHKTLIYKKFDFTQNYIDINDITDFSYFNLYSLINVKFMPYREYNQSTQTFDFVEPIIIQDSQRDVTVKKIKSLVTIGTYATEHETLGFFNRYSTTPTLERMYYSTNNSYVKYASGLGSGSTITTQFNNYQNIINIEFANTIDNVYNENRKHCYIATYSDFTSELVYLYDTKLFKFINLGEIYNPKLYFYSNGIIIIYNKNGKTYKTYYEYNSIDKEYELVYEISIGSYTDLFVVAPNYILEQVEPNIFYKTDLTL